MLECIINKKLNSSQMPPVRNKHFTHLPISVRHECPVASELPLTLYSPLKDHEVQTLAVYADYYAMQFACWEYINAWLFSVLQKYPLYRIVVLKAPKQRRNALGALCRIEDIQAWYFTLCATKSADDVEALIDRRCKRGISRQGWRRSTAGKGPRVKKAASTETAHTELDGELGEASPGKLSGDVWADFFGRLVPSGSG